ncbi:TPA: hypothetical protein HA265_02470 [Candidatus Woesearchaeota archaeon]|nr:hypothetical protein [Candidatus Woesearchaeota archaeon]
MKALTLISSGIDSPVATWIMKKKGLDMIAVHFSNEPMVDSLPKEKTKELCGLLGVKKLYVVKHGYLVQAELMRNCMNDARCVLCRRMMFRVASRIAEIEGCGFLVTGENLGQVASQTLDNMAVTDTAAKIPVLRPLLCYDKQEIVDLAKKIGTYETSIEAAICCRAVPKRPITKAKLDMMEKEEKKIDVDRIVEEAVKSAEVFEF